MPRNLKVIQAKASRAAETDHAEVLPAFGIHDLRHPHAPHLRAAGRNVPKLSRRLGNANPAITMVIYAHALTDDDSEDLKTPIAFAFTRTA